MRPTITSTAGQSLTSLLMYDCRSFRRSGIPTHTIRHGQAPPRKDDLDFCLTDSPPIRDLTRDALDLAEGAG